MKLETMTKDELLAMALVGYEQRRSEIIKRMELLKEALGVPRKPVQLAQEVTAASITEVVPRRRTMSAAVRKRISQAQKARWMQYRKQQGKAA